MSDPYVFQATVLKIIDGDTIDVDVDLGWDISVVNQRIRLFGIDCPESRTRNLEEKKYGLLAKEFVQEFLPIGSEVLLRTLEKGKYGRYLGDFKRYDKWLCAELLRHHHAVEYFGQSKAAIKQAHLENRKKIV
jgi:micrococcal nuclease|tara:strand:- start:372 stop:770 length:399 start_codon:yes stop_codon:yes gene_type:complete